jgi:hypothetical protein
LIEAGCDGVVGVTKSNNQWRQWFLRVGVFSSFLFQFVEDFEAFIDFVFLQFDTFRERHFDGREIKKIDAICNANGDERREKGFLRDNKDVDSVGEFNQVWDSHVHVLEEVDISVVAEEEEVRFRVATEETG